MDVMSTQPQNQPQHSVFDDLKKFTDSLSTATQREEHILLPTSKVEVRLVYTGTTQDNPQVTIDPSVLFPVPPADIEYAQTLARSHGRGEVRIVSNRTPAPVSAESGNRAAKVIGIVFLLMFLLAALPSSVTTLAIAGAIAYYIMKRNSNTRQITQGHLAHAPALPASATPTPTVPDTFVTSVPMETMKSRSFDILAMGEDVFQRAGIQRKDFVEDIRTIETIKECAATRGYFNGVEMDDDYKTDMSRFLAADARVQRVFETAHSMNREAGSPLNLPDQQW